MVGKWSKKIAALNDPTFKCINFFFLVSHYVKSILMILLVFFLIFTQATMDQYCGQIDCTLKTRCLNTQK